MTEIDELRARMIEWDRAAWCLAAIALVLDPERTGNQTDAAADVLTAANVHIDRGALADALAGQLSSSATAPLLQIAALLRGDQAWAEQSDEALIAQGRSSAQAAPLFAQFVLPHLDGLAERFAAPGCRMLDVGVGTGALAAAYAETFPKLTVVGIDVMPRVLALAESVIAASPAHDRLVLRNQDIATLEDDDGFDLAWVPAPFIPPEPLRAGLARIARALRPGGWVMLGHGKFGADEFEDAVNAFKTIAYGGTVLNNSAAQELLTAVGLIEVQTLPTPPGAPALTFGRAPS
jgi:SAM-dependent methyltransferase